MTKDLINILKKSKIGLKPMKKLFTGKINEKEKIIFYLD